MIIIHKIDDLAFELFPELKGKELNNQLLIKTLTNFYSYGAFAPKIEIQSGFIKIEINTKEIEEQDEDYRKAVKFCESGKYEQAIELLNQLISKNPTNSEYHRISGQAFSSIVLRQLQGRL